MAQLARLCKTLAVFAPRRARRSRRLCAPRRIIQETEGLNHFFTIRLGDFGYCGRRRGTGRNPAPDMSLVKAGMARYIVLTSPCSRD